MVDFIDQETSRVIIVTNKVASASDLQIIENCVKNVNYIEFVGVKILHLSQFKSYLKITNIPYLGEFTNVLITSDIV